MAELLTQPHNLSRPATGHRKVQPFQNVIAAATAYTRSGLVVVPASGKIPLPDEWQKATVGQHLNNIRLKGNVGIVAGKNSGNLAQLEIDGRDLYDAFCAAFPDESDTLTVRSGGGDGYHVYLRSRTDLPTTTTVKLGKHREYRLKTDGQQCIAPPSIHPETKRPYTFHNYTKIKRLASLDHILAWMEAQKPPEEPKAARPRRTPSDRTSATKGNLNPRLLAAIEAALYDRGFTYNENDQGRWLNGPSLFRQDRHPSFGYNLNSGFTNDFGGAVHNTTQVCAALGIDPAAYGGVYERSVPTGEARSSNTTEFSPATRVYPACLPDALLKTLNQTRLFPKTAAVVVECVHALVRSGKIDADAFSLPTVKALAANAGYPLPTSTIDATFKDLLEVFFRISDRGLEHLGGVPLQSEFQKNSGGEVKQVGRKATIYALIPLDEVPARVLKRAAYRLRESAHGTTTLAKFGPEMMEAADVPKADAQATAAQLNDRYRDTYQKQDHRERRVGRAVLADYEALKIELADTTTTPLPAAAWTMHSAADYNAARLRGWVEADPNRNRSYAQIEAFLGIHRDGIPALLKRAGIRNEKQTTEAPIKSIDEVQAVASRVRGNPYRIVVKRAGNAVRSMDYDRRNETGVRAARAFVADAVAKGAEVVIEMRTASKQHVETDAQPVIERKPRVATTPIQPRPVQTPLAPPTPEPYYGPGYDPRWVLAQLKLLLRMSTGEVAPDTMTARELIDQLLADDPPAPPLSQDACFAYEIADELGAEVRKVGHDD